MLIQSQTKRKLTFAVTLVLITFILGVFQVVTFPGPIGNGGLFAEMAKTVTSGGPYPTSIQNYTVEGIPFGYPPFQLILTGTIVRMVNLDWITMTIWFPVIFYSLVAGSHFLLSRTFNSTLGSTTATIIFVSSPITYFVHLSAGGFVRAGALLWAILAFWAALSLTIGTWKRRAVIGLAATLAALSHPIYAAYVAFGLGVITLTLEGYATKLFNTPLFGESPVPSVRKKPPESGAATVDLFFAALLSITLASPWLVHITTIHGFDILLRAAGTHGGLFRSPVLITGLMMYLPMTPLPPIWYVLAGLGVIITIRFRQPGLLLLLLLVVFLPKAWLVILPLSLLAGRAVDELNNWATSVDAWSKITLTYPIVIMTIGLAISGGILFMHPPSSTAQIASNNYLGPYETELTPDAKDTFLWIRQETPADSTYVVGSDVGDWGPFITGKPMVISPWGTEWRGVMEHNRHFSRQHTLSQCGTPSCVSRTIDEFEPEVNYVILPQRNVDLDIFNESNRYHLEYRNEEFIIFRNLQP